MTDITALRTELTSDPVALGYAALGHTAAADRLNAQNTGRTLPRTDVPVREIFNAIDNGAWPSTVILQDKLRGVLGMATVDASNANTVGILGSIFPVGGQTGATRTRLLALGTRVVSRAEELGFDPVTGGDVERARAL